MRAYAALSAAPVTPRSQKQERRAAFSALRESIGSLKPPCTRMQKERASLFWLTTWMRCWLRRWLRALSGAGPRVRGQRQTGAFQKSGRRLNSIENKRNDTGLRFVLQQPEEGRHGFLIWQGDHLPAHIDSNDAVV